MSSVKNSKIINGEKYTIDGTNQKYLIDIEVEHLTDKDFVAKLLEQTTLINTGNIIDAGNFIHFSRTETKFYKLKS